MKHFFMITLFAFIFVGCVAGPTYNYSEQKKDLNFKISKENLFVQKLNNPAFRYTFDSCTNHSYVINEERYFIEYISLDSNCRWNGLSSGFFERQFKDKLKLKSFSALERIEIRNYSFSTLKVNDTHVLNIINVYSAYTDLFIIDYEGSLYNDLLKKLKPDYVNRFASLPRYSSDYNDSLVRFNFFHNYFNRESGDIIGD